MQKVSFQIWLSIRPHLNFWNHIICKKAGGDYNTGLLSFLIPGSLKFGWRNDRYSTKDFKILNIWPFLKSEVKNSTPAKGLFPDLALYKTSLQISIPEVVGYKTSLFKNFTPKWLLIRPYGDFVSGLITSPPVQKINFLSICWIW